jgi:hypothetical protein
MTPERTVSCLVPTPAQDYPGTKELTAMPLLHCRHCKDRSEFRWRGSVPSCSFCGEADTYAQLVDADFNDCSELATLRADLEAGFQGAVGTIQLHGWRPLRQRGRSRESHNPSWGA